MRKGYKKCPFCANEIKEGAVKCSFCEEFLDGRDKTKEIKKGKNNNFFKKNIYLIILGIILILLITLGLLKLNNHDSWQGFYNIDDEGEITGPKFNYYFECEERANERISKGFEAFCGFSCKKAIKGSSKCKEIIKPQNHNESSNNSGLSNDTNISTNNKGGSKPYIEKGTQIRGDFDGDGVKENARTYADINHELEEGTCYIQFESNKLPKIIIENCIGGDIVNEGDLNQDGTDEIGINPSRFTSCRGGYQVWTYKLGIWKELIKPISNHCNQRDECYAETNDDCDRISVYGPGKVRIYSSEFTDDGIIGKYSIIDL